MPSLFRNEKVNCENCGIQTKRFNLACHKKRCSAGSLTCSACTNFSINSRVEKSYHKAKKHSKATAWVVHKCNLYDKNCHSFYSLRERKWEEYGAQRGSRSQNIDVAPVMQDVDDNNLKEDLETWTLFLAAIR